NASGTAALIELARLYGSTSTGSPTVRPAHTLVFLSTDGGAFGGLGAAHFAATWPFREQVVAVINLDSIAGPGRPRIQLAGGTASYVFLGSRIVRGWAIELVLVAMLLPFVAVAIDLFARCRRRRIAILPAARSYRSRLAFWLWVGLVFGFLVLVGAWPGGASRPPAPESSAAGHWSLLGVGILAT